MNPLARTDPTSPIAGMPILDVDKARTVVVIKRSLSPGFAGIPNPLFAADNTLMYFADGKKAIVDLISGDQGGVDAHMWVLKTDEGAEPSLTFRILPGSIKTVGRATARRLHRRRLARLARCTAG